MVVAGSTTFELTLPEGIDLSNVAHIVFSVSQDNTFELHKKDTGIEIEGNVVTVTLTQQDTLNFDHNQKAEIQLNWTYSDGTRAETKIYEIDVKKNLYRKVIS